MNKPLAVVISDIHFNLTTLSLASAALKSAIIKAETLNIPLIIAGDLNDTKAIIRAEVANEIIAILSKSRSPIYIMVGNHDLINERGISHGLSYLAPYATIIDTPTHLDDLDIWLIPYHHNSDELIKLLDTIPIGSTLIMHQGFLGASMGDYVQDKTSITPNRVKDFTVISGHYHRHQTIGTITYIGSPYTITFGEANDGPKGFLVLNQDSTFDRVTLNLRKHVILNWKLSYNIESETSVFIKDVDESIVRPGDSIWLKITGYRSELKKLNKKHLGDCLFGHSNFKLDLIALEVDNKKTSPKNMTDTAIFDAIIDDIADTDGQKKYLKELYREIISS